MGSCIYYSCNVVQSTKELDRLGQHGPNIGTWTVFVRPANTFCMLYCILHSHKYMIVLATQPLQVTYH